MSDAPKPSICWYRVPVLTVMVVEPVPDEPNETDACCWRSFDWSALV